MSANYIYIYIWDYLSIFNYISCCLLISVGIHYSVKFFQNNSGSVEMIGGATVVSSFFGGIFGFMFFI